MKIKLFTIPNMLTLASLFCGSFAVVSTLLCGDLVMAFWLTIAAGIFDYSDGFVARLLKSPSEIGVQLDSLSDMVSFGVVPGVVAFAMWSNFAMTQVEPWLFYTGSVICFLVVAFSALRLAKFNIDDSQHTEFEGLPTPANAIFFVALGWISSKIGFTLGYWLLPVAVVMAWLLISPIRMFSFKFKSFGWKGNEIRYLFILVALLLLAFLWLKAVPLIILLYVAVSTLKWLVCPSHDAVQEE